MDKVQEWIKTYGVVLGLLIAFGTFSYNSCATRLEIV
jgi:hypothetical protein